MKLATLKSRLQTLAPQVQPLRANPRATPRLRGRALQEWRASILAREPLCRLCSAEGRVTVAGEVDHILPLSEGGGYEDSNVQPLCVSHHQVKTAREAGQRANGAPGRSW